MTGRLGAPVARRSLLVGAGAASLGVGLAACTSSPHPQASAYEGESRLVALAAALENQAVSFYRALLAAERGGKLGSPAPTLVNLAETCLAQHIEHARAWNSVLRSSHKPAIAGVPLTDQPKIMNGLRAATGPSAVAALAYRLENQAAQTFVALAGHLTSSQGVAAAAGIAPVEAMHAAILRFLLGEAPVPASFAGSQPATVHSLTV